ncbi:MAG: aromatic amino acid transaminase [Woeseiaceae bacterium]
MFETLEPKPADAILKLIGQHRDDPRAEKVDLGVGVYRDAEGNTPILRTVKKAENWLVGTQSSKAYLGSRGDPVYCGAIQKLVFGDHADSKRIITLQSPGGSGALRVGAEVALRANDQARVWVSEPTWNNHVPLLGEAGLTLNAYPYYDTERNDIRFDAMLEALSGASAGDMVLLHGCCHNPTGMDLSVTQWDQVADVLVERQLIPFVDIAYQGFSAGLDEDAYGVRTLFERVPEMIVTQSCSKNFGLYRDRVGALSLVAKDEATADILNSQAQSAVRTMYSLPPDHGGAVVSHILNDAELCAEWHAELADMRNRLKDMRRLLVTALAETAAGQDFSHIERTTGMFCYLGLSADQVGRLKNEHGVYLVDSSRINVCGITAANVQYLAKAIAAVL